jgi:hypothetical protein
MEAMVSLARAMQCRRGRRAIAATLVACTGVRHGGVARLRGGGIRNGCIVPVVGGS